jgi:PEP-CTERM motif
MKTQSQIRIASFSLIALFSLALAIIPASAQVTLYDNGPINGTVNGWEIPETSPGNVQLAGSATYNIGQVKGTISVGVWESPGDTLTSLGWAFTSLPTGGTVFASGTASGANLTDTFVSMNEYGYDIDKVTLSDLNLSLDAGTYWLSLNNAQTPSGDPVFWDENSGAGCGGDDGNGGGCPSQAYDSEVGTIPSEAFTIQGSDGGGSGSAPEPNSLALFGSGVLGIGGLLRRRFLG